MTAGPEYTLEALLDIFIQALDAVEKFSKARKTGTSLDLADFQGFQYEFAQMTRRKQAMWLLHCVRALTMGEVEWIDRFLQEGQ